MKPFFLGGAAATALIFGTGLALASPPGTPGGAQHDRAMTLGAAAAHVGSGSDPDYLQQQQELRNMPGYSIGTGDARIIGGS